MPAGLPAPARLPPGMAIARTVAVFCGSRSGDNPAFRRAAATLGQRLAEAGVGVVYGGGQIGLMGVLANAVLGAGGRIVGVIPEILVHPEIAHPALSGLIVTRDMAARKQRMFDLADAFIALPGGIGTLDETIEMLTWRQLGVHAKPILLCDIQGSAAPFSAFIEAAITQGFAQPSVRDLFEVLPGVDAVLAKLQAFPVTKRSSQWTL
ncbi:MAG: TIGR00730 family Rossman fold protein [Rhodospirillales bacterium]|nr:TIGR00730 family Rossman fold protein [Rhodospirillales bacterium]